MINKTEHKIIFGDAREMKELNNESIDLVITSLPYPIDKDNEKQDHRRSQ
jgi:DNA modification methylase